MAGASDYLKLAQGGYGITGPDVGKVYSDAARGLAVAGNIDERQTLADIGIAYQNGGLNAAKDTAFGRGRIDTGVQLGNQQMAIDKESRAKIADSMKQLSEIGGMAETQNDQQWGQTVQMFRERGMNVPAAFEGPQGRQLAVAQTRNTMEMLKRELVQAQTGQTRVATGNAIDANRRANETQASTMAQYEAMTPDARAQAAGGLGLQPGTPAHNSFVASGKYAPPESATKFINVPKDSRLVIADTAAGTATPVLTPEASNKSDDKFAEAAATKQADRFDEAVRTASTQNQALSDVNLLKQLSSKLGEAGLSNTATGIFGPALRAIGIAPNSLSDREAFTALINRLVPAQRPPGSGTMSDRDVELFKSSLPQLSATAQGRTFILNQMEAIVRYDQARGLIASQAINGEIPRADAERLMRQIPDPMTLFREQQGGGAVRVNSRAEALRLPPGTLFVTPDGKEKVRP